MRSKHIEIHFSGPRLVRPVCGYLPCRVGVPDVGFCGANELEESSGLAVGLVSNSSSFIFGRAHRLTSTTIVSFLFISLIAV